MGVGRFGQQEDAMNAKVSAPVRAASLASGMKSTWPRFLLKVAVQLIAVFAVAAVVFALLGR